MKIRHEIIAITFTLLLCLTNVIGLPFFLGPPSIGSHMVRYQALEDNWNISSVPRSVEPHLAASKQDQHQVPPRKSNTQIEEELLTGLRNIKVGLSGTSSIE